MDPSLIPIMAFFLTAIILTGGFVLLLPLSKQLAKFLEFRMQDKKMSPEIEAELRHLRVLVEGLDDKLRSVSDRQEFLEKILESRDADTPRLPR